MTIDKNLKSEIIYNFRKHELDTGSCSVKIAIFTERIKQLTMHFKSFPKDCHSLVGMQKIIEKRKKSLKYLRKHNYEEYLEITKKLSIRK